MEVKPVRSATIYIEYDTLKRLRLLCRLYPEKLAVDYKSMDMLPDKTADERADNIINQVIEEKFPRVLALEKQLAEVYKEFCRNV